MKRILLDFTRVESRREAHDILAESLDFPDYYGHNLDALYDCATDISEDCFAAVILPDEDAPLYGYLRKITKVLDKASRTNPHLMVHTVM